MEDNAEAEFFIDEIILATDQTTDLKPFIAPGRRKWFVDIWERRNLAKYQKLQCLPIAGLEDIAMSEDQYQQLIKSGYESQLLDLLQGNSKKIPSPLNFQNYSRT